MAQNNWISVIILFLLANPGFAKEEKECNNRTVSLNGDWQYAIDPTHDGLAEGWAQHGIVAQGSISIPGAIQALDELAAEFPSGPATVGMRNGYLGDWWLERSFEWREAQKEKLVWLRIGGIAPVAHIYINGVFIKTYKTPQISGHIDITEVIKNGMNKISILILEKDLSLLGGMRYAKNKWSGIYRDIMIEEVSTSHLQDVTLTSDIERGVVQFTGSIINDGDQQVVVTPEVTIYVAKDGQECGKGTEKTITIPAGSRSNFVLNVKIASPHLWSVDNPFLYVGNVRLLSDNGILDSEALRFGLRSFRKEGQDLLFNGKPFFMAGVGQEFFSPTISPLIDKQLIRQRIRSLKAYGFNFFRCHTYPVLPEVLEVADEEGFLFCSEVSVVSNFNKTAPFDLGLQMLKQHVRNTRHHPSLVIYCLGNEGIQKLVKEEKTRKESQIAYEMLKADAPDQLAMISFGNQGEYPSLKNDIVSPHLWSDAFTWAYDGLSRIPWHSISTLTTSEPTIVHEYGKFGMWPNPKESKLYPEKGYNFEPYALSARQTLQENGLLKLEDRIIENSWRSFEAYSRLVIEDARKQPDIDGYTMWTAFRGGVQNSGFADDMGSTQNANSELFKNGCNAPVALLVHSLIDQRIFIAEQESQVSFYISNFGMGDLKNATIRWKIRDEAGKVILSGIEKGVSCQLGRNRMVSNVELPPMNEHHSRKVILEAVLEKGKRHISSNRWDYWVFSANHGLKKGSSILSFINDPVYERRLISAFPNIIRLKDVASMQQGCLVWQGVDISKTVDNFATEVLITDTWNDTIVNLVESGVNALIIDSGNLPSAWYTPEWANRYSNFDRSTSYTSFRSGWDEGNLTRVIQPHASLDGFPVDGYCNFHFFNLIQYAKPLRTRPVVESVRGQTSEVIVYNIPKIKSQDNSKYIETENQHYLIEMIKGQGRILICSFRLLEDIVGKQLMKELILYLQDHTIQTK
ncbi:MAG: hypothetical protein MI975_28515 [Cytophagales bacterium]|nr:hypothetical protein [Cytophagales bacterium]